MKTIAAHRLNAISMSVNTKLPNRVIDEGHIKQYVGIGWIDEGEATKEDRKLYPIVTRRK